MKSLYISFLTPLRGMEETRTYPIPCYISSPLQWLHFPLGLQQLRFASDFVGAFSALSMSFFLGFSNPCPFWSGRVVFGFINRAWLLFSLITDTRQCYFLKGVCLFKADKNQEMLFHFVLSYLLQNKLSLVDRETTPINTMTEKTLHLLNMYFAPNTVPYMFHIHTALVINPVVHQRNRVNLIFQINKLNPK